MLPYRVLSALFTYNGMAETKGQKLLLYWYNFIVRNNYNEMY